MQEPRSRPPAACLARAAGTSGALPGESVPRRTRSRERREKKDHSSSFFFFLDFFVLILNLVRTFGRP